MFRRRRPLMRAAVAGGGAYVAGKRVARGSAAQGQQENEQDERLATLEERALAWHEQGALTDDEFATAKARLLGG